MDVAYSVCKYLKVNPDQVKSIKDIPFLPISFFKTHKVLSGSEFEKEFTSSGTSGMSTSSHFIKNISIYESAFLKGFHQVYGNIEDYIIIGLLPSYLERTGSSLIYMVDKLIELSNHDCSGFYLDNYQALLDTIAKADPSKKIMLLGVSYALLDLVEKHRPNLSNCIIMETGGMKGKRKEIPKLELHSILKQGLHVNEIHSEYGMTELLSQAYSIGNGKFTTPPWMKVLTREYNDPFSYTTNKTGGLNIIDLANVESCSFIATQDLGKVYADHFEIIGRFDNSDVRGCNLLVD